MEGTMCKFCVIDVCWLFSKTKIVTFRGRIIWRLDTAEGYKLTSLVVRNLKSRSICCPGLSRMSPRRVIASKLGGLDTLLWATQWLSSAASWTNFSSEEPYPPRIASSSSTILTVYVWTWLVSLITERGGVKVKWPGITLRIGQVP